MKSVTLSLVLAAGMLAQSPKEAFFQRRKDLQAHARAAYDREMAREKAGDCRDANTTSDINMCLGAATETTGANYQDYAGTLRGMLAQKSPYDNHPATEGRGPTGRAHTQQEILNEFDQTQTAWEKYREAMCSGVDGLYRSGTIVNAMVGTCYLMLVRSHMRELNAVYGEYLGH